MSFFSELKRRNVFRVAAAYVVSAWLLIEVGNTLEETLNLPDWADTLLAFFLILGFPIALFVSWAYEITPEGIKREKDVEASAPSRSATARKLNQLTVTLMALALVYFALDKWVFTEEPGSGSISPAVSAAPVSTPDEKLNLTPKAPAEETPSVAVLPFINMSPDPDNEYFSDGISEELLNLLVKIEGLRVPSRTSSFAFKGMNTDIAEIAQKLDVGHILEGSVRKAGNRVRVTAQLIDVSTDTHLWSDTYDRELEDIFAIQDEIAGHIVEELKLALGKNVTVPARTKNLEAYTLYLRGLHLFQQRGEALVEAESLLEEAVSLDPGFAKAWGLLALVRVTAPAYLGVAISESETTILEAANHASSLDPALLEPKLTRSQLASHRRDYVESLDLLEQAFEEHPKVALARLWYGIELLNAGYTEAAIAQLDESVRLDPVAGINLDWLARARVNGGEHESGVNTALKAIQLGRLQGLVPIISSARVTGRFDLLAEDTADGFPLGMSYFRHLEQLTENPDHFHTAMEWADQTLTDETGTPVRLYWYVMLEFSWAAQRPRESYETLRDILRFDGSILYQVWQRDGQWFRNHHLGRRLMQETSLTELWKNRGWPDLCRPAGDEAFVCD